MDLVIARAPQQKVKAALAKDRVIARATFDPVDGVAEIGACTDQVIAVLTKEPVSTFTAVKRVIVSPTFQPVGAVAAHQDVIAGTAQQTVCIALTVQRVRPGPAVDRVQARTGLNRVIAGRRRYTVISRTGLDQVVSAIAHDRVGPGAGFEVLDHRARGDAQHADPTAQIRVGPAIEVDVERLRGAVIAQIQRVRAALVVDGERGGAAGARLPGVKDLIHVVAQVRAAPVGGVARGRATGARRAIEILDCRDIRRLGAHHKRIGRVDRRVFRLAEIRHDRHLPAVIAEIGIVLVGDRRPGVVVVALVVQTQGMAKFVDVGLERIAVERGAVAGQPALGHVQLNPCRGRPGIGEIGKGPAVLVIERDHLTRVHLDKFQIGDHLPGLHCPAGQLLALGGQPVQVDGDLV